MESLRRPRALAVDDEPQVRELWREFLAICGCDAETAVDGADGLARFGAGGYDLVVTDLVMPGVSGRMLARLVRQADPAVAVILITGSISEPESEVPGEPGITVLRKPVALTEFRAAVTSCLAGRAARSPAPAPIG
jgi:two-component system cell cycle response regulator